MRVLAIDTALEACAAAVLDTERGTLASESLTMLRGHAEALMPLIARVMRNAEIPFSALDRIAVTTGPGSFTGLRVGIAAARGIALAAAKPVIGLTTLAAYAASKAALETMVKMYALEVATSPLKVNLLDPGVVRTKLRAQGFPGEDPKVHPAPEEITERFVELVEPACRYHGEILSA